MFSNVVALVRDYRTAKSFRIVAHFLMEHGSCEVLDTKADRRLLKVAFGDLWAIFGEQTMGIPFTYTQYYRNASLITWEVVDIRVITRVSLVGPSVIKRTCVW